MSCELNETILRCNENMIPTYLETILIELHHARLVVLHVLHKRLEIIVHFVKPFRSILDDGVDVTIRGARIECFRVRWICNGARGSWCKHFVDVVDRYTVIFVLSLIFVFRTSMIDLIAVVLVNASHVPSEANEGVTSDRGCL